MDPALDGLVDAVESGAVELADEMLRRSGAVCPPTVHMLFKHLPQPYLGSVATRPFRRGNDAAGAAAALGLLPSVVHATRLVVVWEYSDLCAALDLPDWQQGRYPLGLVVLDADLAEHVVRWHPFRMRTDATSDPAVPVPASASIWPEWGTVVRHPDVELPGRSLSCWRCGGSCGAPTSPRPARSWRRAGSSSTGSPISLDVDRLRSGLTGQGVVLPRAGTGSRLAVDGGPTGEFLAACCLGGFPVGGIGFRPGGVGGLSLGDLGEGGLRLPHGDRGLVDGQHSPSLGRVGGLGGFRCADRAEVGHSGLDHLGRVVGPAGLVAREAQLIVVVREHVRFGDRLVALAVGLLGAVYREPLRGGRAVVGPVGVDATGT